MSRYACLLVLVACGHAAPKAAPSQERVVTSAADVKGRWVSEGELDWGYFLEIRADGAYDLVIDRSKMGRCEVKGMLVPAGERAFHLAYGRNECDANAGHATVNAKVTSFTGDVLVLSIGDETRTYGRQPE
jgi:hypothetical protein